jgi:hypothetical protein
MSSVLEAVYDVRHQGMGDTCFRLPDSTGLLMRWRPGRGVAPVLARGGLAGRGLCMKPSRGAVS